MTHCSRSFYAFACVLLISVPAFTQSRNTGEIRGTVIDAQGAAISGATVTVTNIDTGETKEFVTNQETGVSATASPLLSC